MTRDERNQPADAPGGGSLPVDRCVCRDVTFARLQAFVEQTGGGLREIQKTYGCGRGCGLCVPYIRLMLATGRTSFAVNEGTMQGRDTPI